MFHDPLQPQQWILKGGVALLYRVSDARYSTDIDLLRAGATLEEALVELEAALRRNLDDGFRFQIASTQDRPDGGQPGRRMSVIKVDVFTGAVRRTPLSIDLVTGSLMTAQPEIVQSSTAALMPGVPAPTVCVYPTVDHIADKVAATEATYTSGVSTRGRDLVDLVTFGSTQAVAAQALREAINAERRHRSLPVLPHVAIPPAMRKQHQRGHQVPARYRLSFDGTVTMLEGFLNPALDGSVDAKARWNPPARRWDTE